MNRRIPIEAELPFPIIRLRLDGALFERVAIDASDLAALRFGISVAWIAGIGKSPEAIASIEILPAAVGDTTGILGIANPGTVILQTAVNLIRVGHVRTDMIELRYGQVAGLPPGVRAIVGIPDAAVVAGNQMVGVVGIHPNVVKIAMRAARNSAETLSAIFTHD